MSEKLTYYDPVKKELYKTYEFSYGYKDGRWSITLMATSPEDAIARVKRLQYAQYDGEIVEIIPWNPVLPISWGKKIMNGIIRVLNFFRTVTKRKE